MTNETNVSVSEPVVHEATFRFTATGGGLLTHRIAEIEKLALRDIQSGKSLDRVVTGALASLRDACRDSRAAVS
jgi:hypothetical protein